MSGRRKKMEQDLMVVGSRGLDVFSELVKDCPNPTDIELRKMLSIQGTMMTALSGRLLQEALDGKKIDRGKLALGMQAMAQARAAIEGAARIKEENWKED